MRKLPNDSFYYIQFCAHKMEDQSDKSNLKSEKTIASVDLKQLMDEILEDFLYKIDSFKIAVSIDIDQRVKWYADASLIKALIQNIIDNVIQFHDPAKEKKWIKIQGDVSHKNCLITISDNGIVIDEKEQLSIYDPSFQVTGESQGREIGLHIARKILNKMDGGIVINSKPGEGSKFMILIPNCK